MHQLISVLRGHHGSVIGLSIEDHFIFSADENGTVIVWSFEELEELCSFHCVLDTSFMHFTTSAIDNQNFAFLQGRNGKIFCYEFEDQKFQLKEAIACSNLAFCRMSAQKELIAFPSARVENAVNVYDFHCKKYLVKDFCNSGNGMCMFTKFHGDSLLLGFETGRLCKVNLSGEILFDEVVIEDSCNDAFLSDNALFAIGASSKIVCWQQRTVEVPFPGFSSIVGDRKGIITGGWDAKIRIFDENLNSLAVVEHHLDVVNALKLIKVEESSILLAASKDGTISVCRALAIGMKAPFVTPIEKHFPGPVSGAILLFNRARDLSLYRFNTERGDFKHAWSLGRFKALLSVEWSPDGKFIAVLCTKNCFIYEVEEGKKIGSIEAFERSLIRWALLPGVDANLLALLQGHEPFILRSCVDGEFGLPEVKLGLSASCGEIEGFELDASAILTMQTDGTLNNFVTPFVAGQIGSLAALSRALQSLKRVFENLFEGIGKLLRFAVDLNSKLSTNSQVLRNLMLFGGDCQIAIVSENEFLEFKQKLKKLHAELLVSLGDAQSACTRFRSNFNEFGGQEAAKLAKDLLPRLEGVSRAVQHDLAEFLVWLEPLVLEEVKKPVKAMQPQELALRSIKSLLQGKELIDLASVKTEFEANKLVIDGNFAAILGSQKEAQPASPPQSTFKHPSGTRLVSADGTVCLDDRCYLRNGLPMSEPKSLVNSQIKIHENFVEIN